MKTKEDVQKEFRILANLGKTIFIAQRLVGETWEQVKIYDDIDDARKGVEIQVEKAFSLQPEAWTVVETSLFDLGFKEDEISPILKKIQDQYQIRLNRDRHVFAVKPVINGVCQTPEPNMDCLYSEYTSALKWLRTLILRECDSYEETWRVVE